MNMKLIIFGAFIAVLASLFINFVDAEELFCDIAFLTTGEIIEKDGYTFESHSVLTGDGIILTMHRIPKTGGIPVLCTHSVLETSSAFVLLGPDKALAYKLSESGYDVWLGNFRGNRYSRSQAQTSSNYWDFSFHEFGKYDLPAMIDDILAKTAKQRIHYIGHGQGSTSYLTMASLKPPYNEKIISAQLMSAVSYMEYATSPLVVALSLLDISTLFLLLGHQELLSSSPVLMLNGQVICLPEFPVNTLCIQVFWLIYGYHSTQTSPEMIQCVTGHVPAGTSTKLLFHYAQLHKSNNFGTFKTIFSPTKPYDLTKVTSKVVLYHSKNDWLNHIKDVLRLEAALPNVVKRFLETAEDFNHMDFMYGQYNNDEGKLYPEILDNLILTESMP